MRIKIQSSIFSPLGVRSDSTSARWQPETFTLPTDNTVIPLGNEDSLVGLDYRDGKSRLSRYRLSVRADSFREIPRREDNIRKPQTRAIYRVCWQVVDPLEALVGLSSFRFRHFCPPHWRERERETEISYRVICAFCLSGWSINEIVPCALHLLPPLSLFASTQFLEFRRVLALHDPTSCASPEINDIDP